MTLPEKPGYQTLPYPRSRRLVIDAMRAGSRKHMIHGLVEFDVTRPRAMLRAHKERTGESLSFTAFVLHCVGAAVAEERVIHAVRDWRGWEGLRHWAALQCLLTIAGRTGRIRWKLEDHMDALGYGERSRSVTARSSRSRSASA